MPHLPSADQGRGRLRSCSVLTTPYEADFETRIVKHQHDRRYDASVMGECRFFSICLSVLSHRTYVHLVSREIICLEQTQGSIWDPGMP